MPIRLLIADDHAVLRAGLRALVASQSDMDVVAEARDGNETVIKAVATKPDVVVLDLAMPQTSGFQVIPVLFRSCPATRVLILSMYDDLACLRAAFDSGAAGYVTKKAADGELLTAIRAVANGKNYLCSLSQERLAMESLGLDGPAPDAVTRNRAGLISQREREVLVMVAQGYTNRQIAERLMVSVKSIESYRARVQEKLGLQTRVELLRYALAIGLLRSDGQTNPQYASGFEPEPS
ncbi:MAG TPA: response regulator transcription factor [Nitrospira sp.]|nr:response regulator transcription factor [Nitrospira sp.]